MDRRLRISKVGWLISAILAVIYVLVVLASLLLVGFETTGSLQAAFLGLGWNTILGFEIGFLGIVIIGFTSAGISVTVYNLFWRWAASRLKTPPQPDPSARQAHRSWPIKLLAACIILPVLTLIALHLLAPVIWSAPSLDTANASSEVMNVRVQPMNLGSTLNTAMREAEPSFTADGRTMYFNCNNADICVSRLLGTWEEGKWTAPQIVGSPISTEFEEVEPVINAAGDKLYFNSNRPVGILKNLPFLSPLMDVFEVANMIAFGSGISLFDGLGVGHVWVSYQVNGTWSEPRLLNEIPGEPPVNSAFHDHCLSFSSDGNEAFWTSTRPGGFGANDIWTSRRVNGQWTSPENLGPNVNSSGDEHHSMLTPDRRSLYVTSNRPGGYGGEDIYVTTRDADGQWGPLVNLGTLVNGPGNDRCAGWTPDLKIFLFDSIRAGGFGSIDLWWLYFKDVKGYPLASTR